MSEGPERITVTLLSKVSAELEAVAASEGLTKTDVVNRAISFYAFYERERAKGFTPAIYDEDGNSFAKVHVETGSEPDPEGPDIWGWMSKIRLAGQAREMGREMREGKPKTFRRSVGKHR